MITNKNYIRRLSAELHCAKPLPFHPKMHPIPTFARFYEAHTWHVFLVNFIILPGCTHHFPHCLLGSYSEIKPSRTTLKQHKNYSEIHQTTETILVKDPRLNDRDKLFPSFQSFTVFTQKSAAALIKWIKINFFNLWCCAYSRAAFIRGKRLLKTH